jgi:hypothetical protein
MKGWNYIVIEAFCAIDWDYRSKHSKYNYKYDVENGKVGEKVLNKDYDPNIKKPKPPSYCKKKICYDCLGNGCKYLAYSEAEDGVKVVEPPEVDDYE